VIDPDYGITMYARLNERLNGDSVRQCKLGKCSGYVNDFYDSGELLHRGYYEKGRLVMYKNFYKDGTTERDYRHTDDYRSSMKTYYPSGQLRSQVKYLGGDPMRWTDYYENGNVEYHEAYDKKLLYYTERNSYYENGNAKDLLELESKKQRLYTQTEYFEDGTVKATGAVQYHDELLDYIRTGIWKVYDQSGKLVKEQDYVYGKVNEEKVY